MYSMKILFARHFVFYLFLVLCAGGFGVFYYLNSQAQHDAPKPIERVAQATVAVSVKASGKVEAENVARLGFPTTGAVQHIYFYEGDRVQAGDIIASLTQDSIIAAYDSAKETLAYYEYVKQDVATGAGDADRKVAETNVAIAEAELTRITKEYDIVVASAHSALLSTGLAAVPEKNTNDDVPPTISGSYTCNKEGSYVLKIYGSQSSTGHSYILSGLEGGTYSAYTEVASPLGTCGLTIQFASEEQYRNTTWTITLPNTRSTSYVALKHAYEQALTERTNAIERATQALTLARNTEASVTAPARRASLQSAQANIDAARAEVARLEAQVRDYTIKAPFSGTITENTLRIGEVVHQGRTISLMEEGRYEFKARIPEVDIAKIHVGDRADVTFDARPDTPLRGTVTYISPYAEQLEGVAYYDTQIEFETKPEWIRAGMNADVRIITDEKQNVLTLPERFIEKKDGEYFVYLGESTVPTKISTGLIGTNGIVEVVDLPLGTIVTAP